MKWVGAVIVCCLLAVVLLIGLVSAPVSDSPVVETIRLRGVEETGAENLVAAVYLGYRVFDTLGETVVLVLSVTGVGTLLGRKP